MVNHLVIESLESSTLPEGFRGEPNFAMVTRTGWL